MRNVLVCSIHPNKPANKMCRLCKKGFCKHDNLVHDGNGYVCGECNGDTYQKGPVTIKF